MIRKCRWLRAWIAITTSAKGTLGWRRLGACSIIRCSPGALLFWKRRLISLETIGGMLSRFGRCLEKKFRSGAAGAMDFAFAPKPNGEYRGARWKKRIRASVLAKRLVRMRRRNAPR